MIPLVTRSGTHLSQVRIAAGAGESVRVRVSHRDPTGQVPYNLTACIPRVQVREIESPYDLVWERGLGNGIAILESQGIIDIDLPSSHTEGHAGRYRWLLSMIPAEGGVTHIASGQLLLRDIGDAAEAAPTPLDGSALDYLDLRSSDGSIVRVRIVVDQGKQVLEITNP